jgi:hypothetical protein
MKIIYQLLAYSHMRGEWVLLSAHDSEEEALEAATQKGPDDYRIDKIYQIR